MKSPKRNKQTNNPATTLVAFWVPTELAQALDAAAKRLDLDRSKLIRRALRKSLTGA